MEKVYKNVKWTQLAQYSIQMQAVVIEMSRLGYFMRDAGRINFLCLIIKYLVKQDKTRQWNREKIS